MKDFSCFYYPMSHVLQTIRNSHIANSWNNYRSFPLSSTRTYGSIVWKILRMQRELYGSYNGTIFAPFSMRFFFCVHLHRNYILKILPRFALKTNHICWKFCFLYLSFRASEVYNICNKPTRCNSGSIVFINNYKYALHVSDALCVHHQEHYKL